VRTSRQKVAQRTEPEITENLVEKRRANSEVGYYEKYGFDQSIRFQRDRIKTNQRVNRVESSVDYPAETAGRKGNKFRVPHTGQKDGRSESRGYPQTGF
jgi:hypothetical protein